MNNWNNKESEEILLKEKQGIEKALKILFALRKDVRESNGYSTAFKGYLFNKRDASNFDHGVSVSMDFLRYYLKHGKLPSEKREKS